MNIFGARANYGIKKQGNGITGSTLKIVAIIAMLLDHTAATIINRIFIVKGLDRIDPNNLQVLEEFFSENSTLMLSYGFMRLIGRLAFPIFCLLLIEGFVHTSNRLKYAVRLAIFALISEIPFDLAFYGSFYSKHQNVFFTLLIGLLVMQGFWLIKEKSKNEKWLPIMAVTGALAAGFTITYTFINIIRFLYTIIRGEERNNLLGPYIIISLIVGLIILLVYFIMIKKTSLEVSSVRFADLLVLIAGMVLAQVLRTDYSGFGVLTIAVMYGFRKSHFKSMLAGCITLTVMTIFEAVAFFNLILIRAYNGKRGLSFKYVFYLFYPVHLFVLYLICYFANLL